VATSIATRAPATAPLDAGAQVRGPVDAGLGQGALDQDGVLGQAGRAEMSGGAWARHLDRRPLGPHFCGVGPPLERREEGEGSFARHHGAVNHDTAIGVHGARRHGWSLRAEAHDVLSREHDPHGAPETVGQLARDGRDQRPLLAAEGSAVGERCGRLAARRAPRGIGLQVGGLDPARGEADASRRKVGRR
jgi:hypothetical protein